MKSHSKSDARKVVIAALLGNLGIALAKFVAAWLSGSAAILAEGVHSLADTGNQGLLLVGMGLAKKHLPDLYPLGRDKESYFWAFIVALLLFFVGGVFAIYEGLHKLFVVEASHGSLLIPLGLLGEGVPPQVRERTVELVEGTSGVLKVTQFLSMHLGPEAVILALKVRFEPKMALEEIERVIDDIEARVRAAEPGMSKIFVEPDSDYDAAQDLSLRPAR